MTKLPPGFVAVDVNRPTAEELETDVDLGSESSDEAFSAFVGNQPIGLRLRDVHAKLGQPIPPELALYKMFDVWLIPHRFSLIRHRGLAEPVPERLAFDVRHCIEGQSIGIAG